MLSEKISRWMRHRRLRFPEDWQVTWSNEGFVLRCPEADDAIPSFSMRWADVEAVEAFQIDLLTIDAVVLEFMSKDLRYEVMQDTQGWEEFAMAISSYLPAPDFHSWYRRVTRTAFDENRVQIYKRSTADSVSDGKAGKPSGDERTQ